MHGRHMKKAPKFLVFRGMAVLVLVLALSVSSFATVMANTVSANVIDGDKSYSFSMDSIDLTDILAQAEELGLEPLGPLDVADRGENTTTVNVRRGVTLSVSEGGKATELVAYKGDTLEKALGGNNIFLKEEDEITPSRDTVIREPLFVEIKRSCQVTVTADGQSKKVSLVGGTVADALQKANVKLAGKDSANYELDEPLFDKMNIRVSRTVKIKVTVDGTTKEFEVSAETVRAALDKCGLDISADDKLNVDPKSKPTNGMHITVTRVETQEVTEKVEIDYPTTYITSDEMYEDETSVKTPGEKGEKEITYKVVFVAGKEKSREAVSEKIVKEPVPEVVVKGTMVREQKEEESSTPSDNVPNESESSASAAGTFIDANGNTVAYSQMLTGTCTAYSVPGGTTSIGLKAEYGVIAVDPNIIPYGTRLYVTSPDGSVVYGYGVAGDTGGAAMAGDIIADLCYNTIEECSIIGRRTMVVYILA